MSERSIPLRRKRLNQCAYSGCVRKLEYQRAYLEGAGNEHRDLLYQVL